MSDKLVYGCAETGTYSTTGPSVSLSGSVVSGLLAAQLFSGALSDANTATITIAKDSSNWAVYSGAAWSNGSPDSFSLASATLIESAGTLGDSDTVDVLGLLPHPIIGDGTVQEVIALTQAAYNALTPVATTLYIITDG